MIRFGMIGAGWRSEFFFRIARARPDIFEVAGIVGRSAGRVTDVAERFGIPVYSSIDRLLAQGRPHFVVVSISRGATIPVLTQLAAAGMPALVETPPAETIEALGEVWSLVERGARIQVAEQYWAQPHHAARLAFVKSGRLGRPTEAQISVCHGYHGISLMRRFLNILYEPVTVRALKFVAPIVQGPTRDGPAVQETLGESRQIIAAFDFGDRLGVFDFTGDQYFSLVRRQRVLVRGERGELIDESAVYLRDPQTPITVSFIRHSAGINGNLEGNYLKGIQAGEQWMYTNPLAPAALPDEEIAIGACLLSMDEFVRNDVEFYSVAEAAQDRYLDLLMEQAAQTGQPIASQAQPWQQG